MTTMPQLRDAITHLETIVREIESIAQRSDAQKPAALLAARRDLSAHMGLIGTLEGALSGLPDAEDLKREYRTHFSAMRNALALHQAEWPVVALSQAPDAYRASVMRTNVTTTAFLNWIKTQVFTRKA